MQRLEELVTEEEFSSGKAKALTLKMHILMKHTVQHARAFGCLKNTSTASGETAHQFYWKMLRRNQNTSDGLAHLLVDSRIALALAEVENAQQDKPPKVTWTTRRSVQKPSFLFNPKFLRPTTR